MLTVTYGAKKKKLREQNSFLDGDLVPSSSSNAKRPALFTPHSLFPTASMKPSSVKSLRNGMHGAKTVMADDCRGQHHAKWTSKLLRRMGATSPPTASEIFATVQS